jgi:hypothetical protein
VNLPKIIAWLIVIVFVVWAVGNPALAGTDVHTWVSHIVTFIQHLGT